MFLHYLQNHHFPRLEVSARASILWEVRNGSLKAGNAVKNIQRAKGKGAAVLNHKHTKVLRLSMSNQVASHKQDTQCLHQELAAG